MAAEHSDTFHHVRDFPYFELPFDIKLYLPEVFGFQITKFMVLQLVAGISVLIIFRGLARRIQAGDPPSGRWWNFWETLALFIRDQVVRPTIGVPHHHDGHDHEDEEHRQPADFVEGGDNPEFAPGSAHAYMAEAAHPADRYLPFVWTCFFYILICNLLGAIPWLGSATGEINVTGALALVAFGVTVLSGSRELGAVGFLKNLSPSIDVPLAMKLVLVPMIWGIEVVGLIIKHSVLAIRLFANMMAGHTVIAVILGFIAAVADQGWLFYLVVPASLLGQVGIGLLELFVAFLQAYIFAYLATLFIGTAVHPH